MIVSKSGVIGINNNDRTIVVDRVGKGFNCIRHIKLEFEIFGAVVSEIVYDSRR